MRRTAVGVGDAEVLESRWHVPVVPGRSSGLVASLGQRLAADQGDDGSNAGGAAGADPSGGRPGIKARLAFYIPNFHVGGAEQVTVSIVNGLAERGYEVDLVVSDTRGELRSKVGPDVTVREIGPDRIPGLGIVADVPALARYLRRRRPDVIFPQMTHASVVCLAASRLANVDTVVVPVKHSAFGVSEDRTPKARALRYLAVRLYPWADHHVGVSQGVLDSLVERMDIRPEETSVLHNPIDIEAIREAATQPVDHEWLDDDSLDVVLFVGRHEKEKDLETWLRAFARVHEARPSTRAILVGMGSEHDRLIDLVASLGIADVVSFPGYAENPYPYMQRADVFMLSSRFEGLPTVMLEALACGCPIVATDCPSGPREILADGEYGTLAPVGDVAALADGVLATLVDPPDWTVLRGRAEDFSPEVVFDEYERFIRRHVLERAPRATTGS